jgi:hypothetical protein
MANTRLRSRSIAELAAIGRNINQIAKVANEGGGLPGCARGAPRDAQDFRSATGQHQGAAQGEPAKLERRAFRSRRLGSRRSIDCAGTRLRLNQGQPEAI